MVPEEKASSVAHNRASMVKCTCLGEFAQSRADNHLYDPQNIEALEGATLDKVEDGKREERSKERRKGQQR